MAAGVGGRRAEKSPQREESNVCNETNYATSRLRDDQSVAGGQGWPAAGPTQSQAHTTLGAAVQKEMSEPEEGSPGPGRRCLCGEGHASY